jgi:FG-GAP-like repeat
MKQSLVGLFLRPLRRNPIAILAAAFCCLMALVLLTRLRTFSLPRAGSAWAQSSPEASSTLRPASFLGAGTFTPPNPVIIGNPDVFLKREASCTLSEVSVNLLAPNDPTTKLAANFEDYLHAQAFLSTTPDQLKFLCPPLFFAGAGAEITEAVGRTSAGNYYAADASSGKLRILISSDSTSLKTTTSYPVGDSQSTAVALTISDLNSDGKPDIVVMSQGSFLSGGRVGPSYVSVLLGNGDGTFRKPANYLLSVSPENMAVDDVNNDGHPDVVIVGQPTSGNPKDPSVEVLLGSANGTLGKGIQGPSGSGFFNVVIGDFTNNHHKDVAVTDLTSAGHILLGDGTGHFTAMPGSQFRGGPLAAGVFSHSGNVDLAASGIGNDVITIYPGNGNGTFQTGRSYASIFGFNIGVDDIDGDGNPDIVMGLTSPQLFGEDINTSGFAYYLMGHGDGTFAGVPAYPIGSAFPATPIGVADFSGDNKPDVLFPATNTGNGSKFLEVWKGSGNGAFTLDSKATTILNFPGLLAAGDVNGDTKQDAVMGVTDVSGFGADSGEVNVALGNGNDTFQTPVARYAINSTAGALTLGDFDSKGTRTAKLDVVMGGIASEDNSGNPTTGAVYILVNKGHGTFAPAKRIASSLNPVSFATGDLNKDGNLDLVISNAGNEFSTTPKSGSVLVLLGNGDGTFKPPTTLTPGPYPGVVSIADVNGDGKPDLLVAAIPNKNAFEDSLFLYKGNGNGTFQPPVAIASGIFGLSGLAVGDLNGDGTQDIMTTACCGFTPPIILLGKGDGTFPQQQVLPVGNSGVSVALAHLTSSNKNDMVVATQRSPNQFEVFLNRSGS